jgi:hypothetical protein
MMSDSSLLTGVYANVEAYGTLIDRVIDRLRISGSDPTSPEQNRLARLLIDASDHGRSSKSLEALILDSLLRSSTGQSIVNLRKLGERLLTKDVDRAYQKQLETLAKGLEEERAQVAGRLRGR